MKKTLVAALGAALLAGFASAQFIIDGSKDAAYPGSNQFQTTGTGFGDTTGSTVSTAGGSELDGVFAEFTPNTLNMLFTGNLENNSGNRLVLFFDYNGGSAGQNVLAGTNAVIGAMNGLTFDTGFAPDYALILNIANNGTLYVDSVTLPTGGNGVGSFLGGGTSGSNGVLNQDANGVNPAGLLASFNNSNVAGVTGSSAAGASAVTTGIELAIPTSLIGNVTYGTGVRVSAMITNGDGSYLSNQVLGGLPSGTANLETAGNVNFNNYAGNQYFAVPEPASMAAIGLGLVGLVARRRKRSA